jgi:type II restriction enzyme
VSASEPTQLQRMNEAKGILAQIGMPRQQQNDRTALVLLAMCGVTPERKWSEAAGVELGINESMDWMAEHYPDIRKGRKDPTRYAPNTRESVRKYSVQQLMAAGVLEANADKPDRVTNSGDYRYRTTDVALTMLRCYGTSRWEQALANFHAEWTALKERWAAEREKYRVPLRLPDETEVSLSPGPHSALIAAIVEEFAAFFTPDGRVIYLGDTGKKWVINDTPYLAALGVAVDEHGKMPDVVIHYVAKNWLVLIEAVTSRGPIDPKRVDELNQLFGESEAGLVFVTAFPDIATFRKHSSEIAWETDVWIREAPTHLVHYNGGRFLGPYA